MDGVRLVLHLRGLVGGELLRRGQRINRRNLDVGLDAYSFPVGLGDWIDRLREREADHEVIVDPAAHDQVGGELGQSYI
jgi:hypothetical protein